MHGRIIEPSVFGAIAPTCSVMSKQPMIMTGHQHYLDEFQIILVHRFRYSMAVVMYSVL